jgi:D-alanyl-D-alanine carboxypeptidase
MRRYWKKNSDLNLALWGVVALFIGGGVTALGVQLVFFASGQVFGSGTETAVLAAPYPTPSIQHEQQGSSLALPKEPVQLAQALPRTVSDELLRQIEQSLPKQTALHVNSKSFLVADFETGEILLEKDTTKKFPIASLSKIVTALVARDVFKMDKELTVTESAANMSGTVGGLSAGETISVSDLLHALFMQSANDAAETLAQSYGRDAFIKRMNDKVRKLGATSTHFDDPTGLSNGNVSTARDLLLIMTTLFNDTPQLAAMTRIKTYKGEHHTWRNPTTFLALPEYLGGKTGYTTEAGRTAVSLFEVEPIPSQKRKIAVVILKSEARDKDILTILEHIHKSQFILSRR